MDTRHEVAEYLRSYVRTAYTPEYMPCPSPTARQWVMSRVGGTPFQPEHATWPVADGTPMVFVMQLRLDALPVRFAPRHDGLLAFACSVCPEEYGLVWGR